MVKMRSDAFRRWVLPAVLLALLLWMLDSSVDAAQTTAEEMFQRAEARAAALADASPSLDAIRSAARAYEVVVMTYPKSGYADNALWEAAVLMSRAFDQSGDAQDRQKAVKLLQWLSREYPASPLVRQDPSPRTRRQRLRLPRLPPRRPGRATHARCCAPSPARSCPAATASRSS